jgi:hypothetical protein
MALGTYDHDGEHIFENATIFVAKDGVEKTGRFGDCWIKLHCNPYQSDEELYEQYRLAFQPFSVEQLYFARPGTHPGMRAIWVTPVVDVQML